jgi:UDP-N-acetylglucosamine:LPS N-acetylglucosamine transferase
MQSFVRVLRESDPTGERFELHSRESKDEAIGAFYAGIVHHFAPLQGWIYRWSDTRPGPRVAAWTAPHLLREAREMLAETRPDLILCTHFLLTMQLARARRALGLDVPLVMAIPDYGVTTRSFYPHAPSLRADQLLVMSDETRADLVENKGCEPSRVHVSGFLTREPFAQVGRRLAAAADRGAERIALRREARARMPELAGLVPERPTAVFLGGSAWTAKTEPVLQALLARAELQERLNLVVVCGKDEAFAARLRARAAPHLSVLGYVSGEQMATVMGMADVPVLGSLAPATMQELLEVQCGPLLLYRFIPGAETPHAGYIERQGVGLYEPDAGRMVGHVLAALGLAAPQEPLPPRLSSFPSAAARIRADSRRRAQELPDVLSRVLPARADLVGVPRRRTA